MNKPILCLDFDGVCHSYKSGWKGMLNIPDEPVPGLFEFIEEASKIFEIQVFSTRSETQEGRDAMLLWFVKEREKWNREHGQDNDLFVVLNITFPENKPPAFIGIDDRVITFTGNWPDPNDLKSFQPWHKKAKEER